MNRNMWNQQNGIELPWWKNKDKKQCDGLALGY